MVEIHFSAISNQLMHQMSPSDVPIRCPHVSANVLTEKLPWVSVPVVNLQHKSQSLLYNRQAVVSEIVCPPDLVLDYQRAIAGECLGQDTGQTLGRHWTDIVCV